MNEIYKKNEAETNEIVSKTILFFLGFLLIICFFCWMKIFDINNDLINSFMIVSLIPLILPTILVNTFHLNRYWVKYVLITCVVLVTGIAYVFFTFQTLVIFVLPSIIAIFYLDLKVIIFTGLINVINITLSHFITCFCLFQPWIEPFNDMKRIMLYGAIPRIMQYLFCTFLLYFLCKRQIEFFQGFYQVVEDEKKANSNENAQNNTKEWTQVLEKLTGREKDVFELLVQGYTNSQIANQLYLSNGTVKNYVSVIYDKIGMKDRTALVIKYSGFYSNHD